MKIQVRAEYKVRKVGGMFEALDCTGLVLCNGATLDELMADLTEMVEDSMLMPQTFDIQLIDIIGDAS
jgi:hypothetical protein